MITLGISAFFHSSAAAIVVDGKLIAAAAEERFTRRKFDKQFPLNAIRFCLEKCKISAAEINCISFYEIPSKKRERNELIFSAFAPLSFGNYSDYVLSSPPNEMKIEDIIRTVLPEFMGKIIWCEHHRSHASSAYFTSPFRDATILCLDGVGEWDCTSIWHGVGSKLTKLKSISFPNSLGLFYSMMTAYCGFKVNDGEYKLMGLAPYGRSIFFDTLVPLVIDFTESGAMKVNAKYCSFASGENQMFSSSLEKLLGGPARLPGSKIDQRIADIAASTQAVFEAIFINVCRHTRSLIDSRNICLSGGCALNCVSNGKLRRNYIFDDIWVQPACGDDGAAVGAAYYAASSTDEFAIRPVAMKSANLGPTYSKADVTNALIKVGMTFEVVENEDDLISKIVMSLIEGKVIGIFDGGMEFGPRALGSRSILADPRRPEMQSYVNLVVKGRESFRPFAPSVLEEYVHEWFDVPIGYKSRYMLFVEMVRGISLPSQDIPISDRLKEVKTPLPAITHIDGSARVHTVPNDLSFFRKILESWYQATECPVLLNTSFNSSDEPIVCSPTDAIYCFNKLNLDNLFFNEIIVHRNIIRDDNSFQSPHIFFESKINQKTEVALLDYFRNHCLNRQDARQKLKLDIKAPSWDYCDSLGEYNGL